MAKKDNIINKSLENAPKVDREINRQLVEKYAQYIGDERTASPEFEVTIRGVEKYSRPKFAKRIGAVAAILAVIVGIGGTTMLMQRAGIPDDQMTNDAYENSSDATTENSSVELNDYLKNNCDMSTKEGVYTKIRNSYMFFDKVSGIFVSGSGYDEGIYNMTEFQIDLTTTESNVFTAMYYNNLDAQEILGGTYPEGNPVVDGNGLDKRVIYDCDGKNTVSIYNDMTYDYDFDSGEVAPRDKTPVVCGYLDDGIFGAINSTEPNKGMSSSARFHVDPYEMYQGVWFMEDMNCWNISGEIECLGRECVSVDIRKYIDGDEYRGEMVVDKETGYVLKFVMYKNYEVFEYMSFYEIAFDENALDVEHVDLNGYTRSKRNVTTEIN